MRGILEGNVALNFHLRFKAILRIQKPIPTLLDLKEAFEKLKSLREINPASKTVSRTTEN